MVVFGAKRASEVEVGIYEVVRALDGLEGEARKNCSKGAMNYAHTSLAKPPTAGADPNPTPSWISQ